MGKTARTGKSRSIPEISVLAWWMNERLVGLLVAALAIGLYLNTLGHGFILDDGLFITKNVFTTRGFQGMGKILSTDSFVGFYQESAEYVAANGGRYRPLPLLVFAAVHQVFGPNPMPYHLLNVILYGLLGWFLYRVLRKAALPMLGEGGAALFSLLATLLFVVHPVHTEVVNNVSSMDLILCLLLSAASLHLAVRYQDQGRASLAGYSGIALFLALLAHETAIIFAVLVPLLSWIRRSGRKGSAPGKPVLPLVLAGAFLVYFAIRLAVVGWTFGPAPLELMSNPFIKYHGTGWVYCTQPERLAMIFFGLWEYLVLLFWPATLTSDYFPRMVEVMTFDNPQALLGLVAFSLLAFAGLFFLWIKGTRLTGFGLWWYVLGIGLVSNLVYPVGTLMAERFLFIPSLGFTIALAVPLQKWLRAGNPGIRYVAAAGLAGIVILLSLRTISRNPAFKSNETLCTTDIGVSTRSAKMQNSYAAIVAEKALNSPDPGAVRKFSEEALEHLNQALTIHPTYIEAFYMRGNVYFLQGQYESAVGDYRRCLELNPNFREAYGNYALALREAARGILAQGGDTAQAIRMLEESLRLFPQEAATRQLLDQALAQPSRE